MKFVSRFPFLKVCISAEQTHTFADGRQKIMSHPRYARFKQGAYVTDNRNMIETLLFHPSYNHTFYSIVSEQDKYNGEWQRIVEEDLAKSGKKPEPPRDPKNLEAIEATAAAQSKVNVKTGMKSTMDGPAPKPVAVEDILKKAKVHPV